MDCKIIALVPAHNEELTVGETVRSLMSQSVPPSAVYVMADNCTDGTVEAARLAGAVVVFTVDNTAKKAGALNQGLALLDAELQDSDFVIAMDADSVLEHNWIENGIRHIRSGDASVVGAACLVMDLQGVLPLVQRVEYVMQRRRISKNQGRIEVLSGAGILIPMGILRHVERERGGQLPGNRGNYYDDHNLTEDFELTVAIKCLGYQVRSFKDMVVTTDAMRTTLDLVRQRVRWQRGTLETLWLYRGTRTALRGWATQLMIYGFSLATPLLLFMWAYTLTHSHGVIRIHWVWLAVVPVFLLDQMQQAWKAGKNGRILTALMFPLWFYDAFRNTIYWYALAKSVFKTRAAWQ